MRLRVQVSRHELPPVKLLWEAEPIQTVVEFLERINHFVPLEAEGWGLEDYAVEVTGYECLHFNKLGDVLKDEDEVVIRALETNDIRARTLSGRHQITADGRRLYDGIAFGRPLLRTPSRPAVTIPPRRTARIQGVTPDEDQDDGEQEGDRSGDYVMGGLDMMQEIMKKLQGPEGVTMLQELQDLEEEEAEDVINSAREPPRKRLRSSENGQSNQQRRAPSAIAKKDHARAAHRRVSFQGTDAEIVPATNNQMVLAQEEEEDEETDDSDWGSLVSDGVNGSIGSSEDDSVHNTDSGEGESSDESSDSTSDLSSDSESSSSGSDSDNSSEEQDDTLTEERNSSEARRQIKQAPPGAGRIATQKRNIRRKISRRLAFLKAEGILPPSANKEDLEVYELLQGAISGTAQAQNQANNAIEIESDESTDESSESSAPSIQSSRMISHNGVSSSESSETLQPLRRAPAPPPTDPEIDEDLEKQRDALLALIDEGGIDVTENAANGLAGVRKKNAQADYIPLATETPTSSTKRARLDVAGSQRMLLGSLGVRAPKSAEEREKLQKLLASQGQRKPVTISSAKASIGQTVETPEARAEAGAPTDPNFWKAHINLTATECCDEDVDLGTPPFPYYHRWTQEQRGDKKRKRNQSAYTAPKKHQRIYDDDDDYNEEGAELDYGDETVLIHSQGLDGTEEDPINDFEGFDDEAEIEEDDFPPLPADLDSLPIAKKEDAIPGTVLAFTILEVSAANNWQPALSSVRTARIEEIDDKEDMLGITVAKRDQPRREYDDEGNRVYKKFEMQGVDDGDEEEMSWVRFEDMVGARVLVSGRADAAGKVVNEDQASSAAGRGSGLDVDDTVDGLDHVMAEERQTA